MDSHQKKNQYRANHKSIHGHVIGRENQIQSIQSKSNPNPITQYCNTNLFIQKKKNPIQRKPNPRPRANQTHGEMINSLHASVARRCSSLHASVARRPRLVVVARPPLLVARRLPLVIACHEGLVTNRSRRLGCSSARPRPQGISLSFSF